MYQTKNDLPEKTHTEVVALLQARLSDGIDLVFQGKHAHWNVKGPHFIALHELFDKVVSHATDAADLMAERIAQLGGTAEGTIRTAAKRSRLAEYPLTISSGRDHTEALSNALAAFGKSIRQAISTATEMNDLTTADLFTEISRETDADLWFVEAHLQSDQ